MKARNSRVDGVCFCACVFVCICGCAFVYACIHMHLCVHVCLCVYVYICVFMHVPVFAVSADVWMYISIGVSVCSCMYVYMAMRVQVCLCVHACVCTCMCTCVWAHARLCGGIGKGGVMAVNTRVSTFLKGQVQGVAGWWRWSQVREGLEQHGGEWLWVFLPATLLMIFKEWGVWWEQIRTGIFLCLWNRLSSPEAEPEAGIQETCFKEVTLSEEMCRVWQGKMVSKGVGSAGGLLWPDFIVRLYHRAHPASWKGGVHYILVSVHHWLQTGCGDGERVCSWTRLGLQRRVRWEHLFVGTWGVGALAGDADLGRAPTSSTNSTEYFYTFSEKF